MGFVSASNSNLKKTKASPTHVVEVSNELRMFIGDVFLHERRGLEQFLTSLASKFAFIFLFDVRLDGLG